MTDDTPEQTDQAASPLLEVTLTSLAELFDRDPMGYTDIELRPVVEELHRMRLLWSKADAEKAVKPKPIKGRPVDDQLSLEELGL